MALNFSHRPIFSGGLSEENLSSGDGFGKGWHDVDYGCDRGAAAQECVSKDILDILPSDPFGMDMSTTFTAITGWLEMDYGGYRRDEVVVSDDNYQLFAGLNFFWNNAMRFHAFPSGGNMCSEEKKSHGMSGFGECSTSRKESSHFGSGSACDVDDMLGFGCESKDDMDVDDENCLGGDGLAPHPALNFALSYLGLSDLLVVERVCKSLHSTVRGDPLLWRSIDINLPLNERITDDVLLQLTNRAQGKLQCLRLVKCARITEDGLKRVLEANPMLTKLSVPECTRLSIEGIVGILKTFKSMGTQGVKHLHIAGFYDVTQKHYEEIMLLLGTDTQMLQHSRKPHFYHRANLYLSHDDVAIDIEVCPICQNLRLVYDCPAEGCQGVGHATQVCRACILCITRCSQCGRCTNDSIYEETFCLEALCSFCQMDGKVGPTKFAVLPEQS